MYKHTLAALAAAILFAGCGGSGGVASTTDDGGGAGSDTTFRSLSVSESDLARYLAAAQLPHGAYDWRQPADQPLDLTVSGYQNVTGVSLLGLFLVYDHDVGVDGVLDQAPFVASTLERSKVYLLQVMADLNNDVGGVTWVSLPNFIFMAEYRERFGLEDLEWTTVQDAFAKILATNDAADGFEGAVVSDGIWGRIKRTRANLPGIQGWDLAFLYKALVAMESDPVEIAWVYDNLKLLAADTLLLDPSESWLPASLAHLCEVFSEQGDTDTVATTVLAAVLALGAPDGSYGDAQTTAYVCLALAAAGMGPELDQAQVWLRGEIDALGRIVDASRDVYFETQGECLQGLLR